MDRTQLHQLLPHQGQALWIDQVLSHDASRIHGLCDSAHLRQLSDLANPAYLFEAAAQLCAAHGALQAQADPQQAPITAAFVGKVSQLHLHQAALPEGSIELHAEQQSSSPAGASYAFRASAAEQLLVDGKLLLVLVRD